MALASYSILCTALYVSMGTRSWISLPLIPTLADLEMDPTEVLR